VYFVIFVIDVQLKKTLPINEEKELIFQKFANPLLKVQAVKRVFYTERVLETF